MEDSLTKVEVFLGGSCKPSTWRKDISIPILEEAGVKYFDPVVEEWSDDCIAIEAAAKATAQFHLFMSDGVTRGIASMVEAADVIASGKDVTLVIRNVADGDVINGQTITGSELKDLNRGRSYLVDVANVHKAKVFDHTVEDGVAQATKYIVEQRNKKAVHQTGMVRWFNFRKGYGFIAPDDGSEDIFVHQSNIKANGFRSLAKDERVEFFLSETPDKKRNAVEVTGPGGLPVQGTPRRSPSQNYNPNFRRQGPPPMPHGGPPPGAYPGPGQFQHHQSQARF